MLSRIVTVLLRALLVVGCSADSLDELAETRPRRPPTDGGVDGGKRLDVTRASTADAGDAGRCGVHSASRTARVARSRGFNGLEEDYFALYDFPCEEAAECVGPCEEAGGTREMCRRSDCVQQFDDLSTCLPPPVWRNLDNILFEGSTVLDAVEITLVETPYHDVLFTEEFKFEITEHATIDGIVADVRRAGSERVADEQVRLHLGSELAPGERAEPKVWSPDLEWVRYGAEDDTWGREWSPAEINRDDFGLAIALVYTRDAGNARGYVDQVELSVHYHVNCE